MVYDHSDKISIWDLLTDQTVEVYVEGPTNLCYYDNKLIVIDGLGGITLYDWNSLNMKGYINPGYKYAQSPYYARTNSVTEFDNKLIYLSNAGIIIFNIDTLKQTVFTDIKS